MVWNNNKYDLNLNVGHKGTKTKTRKQHSHQKFRKLLETRLMFWGKLERSFFPELSLQAVRSQQALRIKSFRSVILNDRAATLYQSAQCWLLLNRQNRRGSCLNHKTESSRFTTCGGPTDCTMQCNHFWFLFVTSRENKGLAAPLLSMKNSLLLEPLHDCKDS